MTLMTSLQCLVLTYSSMLYARSPTSADWTSYLSFLQRCRARHTFATVKDKQHGSIFRSQKILVTRTRILRRSIQINADQFSNLFVTINLQLMSNTLWLTSCDLQIVTYSLLFTVYESQIITYSKWLTSCVTVYHFSACDLQVMTYIV